MQKVVLHDLFSNRKIRIDVPGKDVVLKAACVTFMSNYKLTDETKSMSGLTVHNTIKVNVNVFHLHLVFLQDCTAVVTLKTSKHTREEISFSSLVLTSFSSVIVP